MKIMVYLRKSTNIKKFICIYLQKPSKLIRTCRRNDLLWLVRLELQPALYKIKTSEELELQDFQYQKMTLTMADRVKWNFLFGKKSYNLTFLINLLQFVY